MWHAPTRREASTARRLPLGIEVRQVRHHDDRRVRGLVSKDAAARLGLASQAALVLSAVSLRRGGVQIREVEAVGGGPVVDRVATAVERCGEWNYDIGSRRATALHAVSASADLGVYDCRHRAEGYVIRGRGKSETINDGCVGRWRVCWLCCDCGAVLGAEVSRSRRHWPVILDKIMLNRRL
jgi:hypothetical protein